jgi:hypothetical protein
MKKHSYVFAVGIFGLLMVVGAKEARAQICIGAGQAQYIFGLGSVGGSQDSQLTPVVLGGLRLAGQNAQPINGGDFLLEQDPNNSLIQLAIHEAGAAGGASNPAATTLIVIANRNGQQSAIYSRTTYGGGTPQPPEQGNLSDCPQSGPALSSLLDD